MQLFFNVATLLRVRIVLRSVLLPAGVLSKAAGAFLDWEGQRKRQLVLWRRLAKYIMISARNVYFAWNRFTGMAKPLSRPLYLVHADTQCSASSAVQGGFGRK